MVKKTVGLSKRLHMKKTNPRLAAALTLILFLFQHCKPHTPTLGQDPITDVVAAMTLEEKAKLVVGMGFRIPGMPPAKKDTQNQAQDTGASKGPGQGQGLPGVSLPASDPEGDSIAEKVPGAAGRTHPIPRLGIPSITLSDGPAGIRISPIRNGDSSKTYYATAFPVATLLASSWDTNLVRTVGAAFGDEVLQYGADVLLGPGMNIQRNPLGGRNFEYYSEDPLISGSMAAAMVQGLQSNGVGTSIKHFAANNQETDRMTVNTLASPRALREIYLKNFEIAVKKAQPWTVMSSYNLLNGTYTSQNKDLLTTILRDEWGFNGLVMTDWFGGDDPVAQMKAGNDLIMPGSPDKSQKIVEAVKNGTLDQAQLDKNVTHILELIINSPEFKKTAITGKPDLTDHAHIVRQAAAQGMILLKNDDNTLPLKNVHRIALLGNTSYNLIAGGTGSGSVNTAYAVPLSQGLADAGFQLDSPVTTAYTQYLNAAKERIAKENAAKGGLALLFPSTPPAELTLAPGKINDCAHQNDVVILTIGRNAGEGKDREPENDFNLSKQEKDLINTVAKAAHGSHKKFVVVLNIGGPIEIASWRNQADAILLAWQPGLEGGHSMADVLTGKTNPSGHLATTFPANYKDVPSAGNFPGTEFKDKATKGFFGMPVIPAEVTYKEGIYVGYRYYTTFGVHPAYPFGYGLSYTQFVYSGLTVDHATGSNTVDISLDITNHGAVAGREVAQIYLSAPKSTLDKPAEELKAFGKTKELQPGEKQTLHFSLTAGDLASFDPGASAWIADAGSYTVKAGASSEDIRETADFSWAQTTIVEKVHSVLAPQSPIDELKK